MFPEPGTPERHELETESLREGQRALQDRGGQIEHALYDVYIHFRMKFVEQYGLMDTAPRSKITWEEALTDAEILREHVRQRWAAAIVASYDERPSEMVVERPLLLWQPVPGVEREPWR